MMVRIFCGVLLAVCWSCALASQCPTDIPDHCTADLKKEFSPLMASIGSTASAGQVVHMCRVMEHDIAPVRKCVVKSVPDHCPAKATLLQQLEFAHKLCKAMIECPGIESKITEAQEACQKDLKAKTTEAMLRGGDMCSVMRKGFRCMAEKFTGCPALVTAYAEMLELVEETFRHEGVPCASASMTSFSNQMHKHVILRRNTDCATIAPTIQACSLNFVHAIMEKPMDTVFVCSKTRDFVQNCIAANTRDCPEVRRAFLSHLPEAQKRTLERSCGSGIFNMDGAGTTPSWYATCDTQKAMQCVPKYTQHMKNAMKQFVPPSDMSTFNADTFLRKVKQGMMDMVDFNVVCRMMTPREATIRPCLSSAFASCTNHQLREQYYTGILNLLNFCKIAQDCYLFSKANYKMKQCFGTKFDQLMSQARASGRPMDQSQTCSYVKDLAMCMYASYDVCPRAQTYIRQKMFIGTGLQQMRDQCPGLTLTFPGSGSAPTGYPRSTPVYYKVDNTRNPNIHIAHIGGHSGGGSDACSPTHAQRCLNLDFASMAGSGGGNIGNMVATICRKLGSQAATVRACLQQQSERCNRDPQATDVQKLMIKNSVSQIDFCVTTQHCTHRHEVYTRMAGCIQKIIGGAAADSGKSDMCSKIQDAVNCMYEATKPCPGAWTSLAPSSAAMLPTNHGCPNIHMPVESGHHQRVTGNKHKGNSAVIKTGSFLAVFTLLLTTALLR